MKVSIITICYNNEKDIKLTIESVINQSYKNIEYIIIDGGSKDSTLNIVSDYKETITTLISEKDKGLYDAINKGIKYATGDIVGLIHAGDRIDNNFVVKKIVSFFENSKIDVSYGHSKIVDKNDKSVRINKSPEYNKKNIRKGWMPSHQSIYIRRELFSKIGLYSLELHPDSDYEFFLRYFYFNNLNIKLLDEYIVKFSLGGVSSKNYSSRLSKESKNRVLRSWSINGVKPPFGIFYLKILRKFKQFYLAKKINFINGK
jgi:glycosyltransferase involved in cell wall biosynthesis